MGSEAEHFGSDWKISSAQSISEQTKAFLKFAEACENSKQSGYLAITEEMVKMGIGKMKGDQYSQKGKNQWKTYSNVSVKTFYFNYNDYRRPITNLKNTAPPKPKPDSQSRQDLGAI